MDWPDPLNDRVGNILLYAHLRRPARAQRLQRSLQKLTNHDDGGWLVDCENVSCGSPATWIYCEIRE